MRAARVVRNLYDQMPAPKAVIAVGACALRCPAGALAVNREARSFEFDPLRCIVCGLCVEACTKGSLELASDYRSPTTDRVRVVPAITTDGRRGEGRSE